MTAKKIREIVAKLLFPIALSLPHLSMTSKNLDWILSEEDIEIEQSQSTPALSSVPTEKPQWESFNEWQCFPIESINLECSVHILGEGLNQREERYPCLVAMTSTQTMSFDFDETSSESCESALDEWRALLHGQRTVCVYAAYLQDLEEKHGYWIGRTLKTASGYWPPPHGEEQEDAFENQNVPDAIGHAGHAHP